MIVGFQLFVWLPAPFADPHKIISWAGNAQNLAITGAAWIVADFLAQTTPPRLPVEALPQPAPAFDQPQH
jgi:hypothetical protein